MRYVFLAIGTYGDVLPLLGLAKKVRDDGARVTMIAPPAFAETASCNGIDFQRVMSDADEARSLRDMHLLSSRYSSLFIRRHAVRWNYEIYKLLSLVDVSDTVVIASNRGFLWADICAFAHCGLPVIRAFIDPPGVGTGESWREGWLPPSSVQYRLAASFESEWRRRLIAKFGLSVGRDHISRLGATLRKGLSGFRLYPAWLARANKERGGAPALGFSPPPSTPPGSGADFLPEFRQPKKLLVFMLGTTGTVTPWWRKCALAAVTQACNALDCNGLVTGDSAPAHGWLIEGTIAYLNFVPLDRILEGAHAIVHHGGIGTSAAAIRYGVPQVIVARVFSQFHNARLLERAGMATVIQAVELTTDGLLKAINEARTRVATASHPTPQPNRYQEVDARRFQAYVNRVLSCAENPSVEHHPELSRYWDVTLN